MNIPVREMKSYGVEVYRNTNINVLHDDDILNHIRVNVDFMQMIQ